MKKRRVSTKFFLYFLMLMLMMVTVGCSSSDNGGPAAATTYSISGVVALTGGPLTGAKVTLSGKSTRTYKTGADGTYSFTGLANGTYTVTPVLAGYTFNPASKVVVINGSNMTADFVATSFTGATYSISGKVTGVEVLGAKITFSSASTIAEVLTDGDGNYISPSLPAGGHYTVTPYHSGYAFTPANISGIILSSANSAGNDFASESSNFTQADLEGTWNYQSVETGSWNGWVRGTVTIASDGTVTFDSCFNIYGACSLTSVVFTIDSLTGEIVDSGNAYNHYTMASNKTFIAGTQHDVGTTHPALIIFQKKVDGTVYANTDLKSKSFVFHQLNVGASEKWKYGKGSIDSSRAINISSETDPSGTDKPGDVGATISVDSDGFVTMSDNTTWKGFLSADKRMIVGTVTEGTEYHMMIIQIIDVHSSHTSHISGVWYGHMLATGAADPAPFWVHQTISIDGGKMYTLSWVSSNSTVTAPTKPPFISIGSSRTATVTGSDFNGQLSYDGKFIVGTETFDTGVFALDVITY